MNNNNGNALNKYFNNKKLNSSKSLEYIIILILIIICIIIIIVVVIGGVKTGKNRNKQSPMILREVIQAYNISNDEAKNLSYTVPNIHNGQYSISMWLYIEDYNYELGKDKVIIRDGDHNLVYLDKIFNNLVFNLQVYTDDNSIENKQCKLKNISIQKWNNVILILKNRTVEIYLNGRLENVCYLKSVPTSLTQLTILPKIDNRKRGFYGRMSKVQYINKAANFNEIQDIFQGGPY